MINVLFCLFWIIFFLFFQSSSLYGGDAGDLISASYVQGMPHPPSFPLYSFIGNILTHLPIDTIAWRMGLLSSVPMAFSLVLLFIILKKVHKNTFFSIVSVLIVGFTYPVWLFSTVTEVLALNTFFSILLIYIVILWFENKKNTYIWIFFFVLGLGMTHHQIIAFLLPAFFYLFYHQRKSLPKNKITFLTKGILIFFIGFIFYGYTWFVTFNNAPILWGNADTILGIVKIFSREMYGTFQSGADIAQNIGSRFVNIFVYMNYVYEDFTILGIILILFGFYSQFKSILRSKGNKKMRDVFFFLLLLCSGPLYFFYASYKLNDNFRFAVFEKFLVFSYPMFAFYLSAGMIFIKNSFENFLEKYILKIKLKSELKTIISIFFIILPIILIYINYPKLILLKNDYTAEKFGVDILDTPEKNSILILATDTTLFNTQYVYYCLHKRPDIKLFFIQRLIVGDASKQIKKYYPDLLIPQNKDFSFLPEFILKNYKNFPIYSNVALVDPKLKEYVWVQYGLLYRLYNKKNIPTTKEVVLKNTLLWKSYQDPLGGSLGKYQNLLLANVLTFYELSHQEYGKFLIKIQNYENSLPHFNEAIVLNPENPNNYYYNALALYYLKRCDKAKNTLDNLFQYSLNNKPLFIDANQLMGKIFESCYKDNDKAKKFYDVSKRLQNELNTPIEKL